MPPRPWEEQWFPASEDVRSSGLLGGGPKAVVAEFAAQLLLGIQGVILLQAAGGLPLEAATDTLKSGPVPWPRGVPRQVAFDPSCGCSSGKPDVLLVTTQDLQRAIVMPIPMLLQATKAESRVP